MAKQTIKTGERPISKTKDEIVKEASRIEESLLFSSKRHFVDADRWGSFHLWIGVPTVIMSAIVGAAALTSFDPSRVLAGLLAILVSILSGIATFLNPNERVNSHFQAGNKYDALLNAVRLFRTIDCWSAESDEVLSGRLKNFSEQKSRLNETSPKTSKAAYKKAKKGIESGESDYVVDKSQSIERVV